MIKGVINIFSVAFLSVYIFACNPTKKVQAPEIKTIKTTEANKPGIAQPDKAKTDALLTNLLKQYPQYFDSILLHKKDWNVQIVYTQIDRAANNTPKLTNYYFNVNPDDYFYPASTVKFPAAILALQKLNELKEKGIDKNTTMITEAAYSGQTPVYNDPTTFDGKPTIANYIKKIFLVSDNDAFNRVYEFLGQEYLNEQLHKKGYKEIQLVHRLQIPLSEEENRHTNPFKFLDVKNNVLYQQPLVSSKMKYANRQDSLGNAFYKGNELVSTPMNFSKKNKISLESLHNILRSIVFPNTVGEKQRFNLTDEDYKLLLQYMSQYPAETSFPAYDVAHYPDAYVKFLLYGSQKESLPKNIRIFNKVGNAYGQLIDVAYVVDFDKKIEFFLSAAIYCNKDGVLNDDKYDYETIGYPFMKNLGKVIYDYETGRKRTNTPDLSSFKIEYDK